MQTVYSTHAQLQ